MSKAYINSLTPEQKNNAKVLVQESYKQGITNKHALSAILSMASKETEFQPISEKLNYTASRITEVFKIPTHIAVTLANNPEKLANYVYGGKNKNAPNEGYKFRGRGFANQLTFKSNYADIGKRIGVDLVANPDLLLQPKIAAMAAAQFYLREFAMAKKAGILKQYGINNINDFKDNITALNAFFQANRGWGKTHPDTTGGYKKASQRIDYLSELITISKNNKSASLGFFL